MGTYCKNCKEYGLSVIDTLAYTPINGAMYCEKCNRRMKVPRLIGMLYSFLESFLVCIVIVYSLTISSAFPFFGLLVLMGISRAFILPLLAEVEDVPLSSIREKLKPKKQ